VTAAGPTPLVVLAAAWLGGLLCAEANSPGGWQLAVAIAALSAGIASAIWGLQVAPGSGLVRGLRWRVLALWATSFVAGMSVGPRPVSVPLPVPAGMARFDAVVVHTQPGRDARARSVLRVLRGARIEDGEPVTPGVLLSAGPTALPSGARIRVVAKLAPGLAFRNPSPHPPLPRRFELQGRAFIPDRSAVRVLFAPAGAALLDAARARVRDRIEATLPPRSAGVARALVLGEGDAVDPADQAEVRDAGLLHVFAVSGLHVAILAGLAVASTRRALLWCTPLAARVDVHRIACAAGAPLALLYAAFAGGAPSAWRAACTAALGWLLIALGRRPDPAAITAMAVIVLGALDPGEATRPAFLLSIAATAAILSAEPEPAHDLRGFVRAAFLVSTRTWLATAPVVLWCFGSVPVVGLVANVVLLPLGSFLLQLAAAHALLCTLTPFGALGAGPFTLASDAFLGACRAFAAVDPGIVWPPPDVPQGLTLAATAATLLLVRNRRARGRALLIAALALGLLELRLRAAERPLGRLRATFVDVGQGDAALVDLPDGRLMLIDAGGNPGGGLDPGRAALLPLLQARRRDRIDVAVLTHPHPDHYGGFAALLDQVAISELWDSGQTEAERDLMPAAAEASQLLAALRVRGTRVRTARELCGRTLVAGAARVRVLWPCPRHSPAHDANDNSLVVRIDHGRHRLLFAGDTEQHAESELIARKAPLRADVLKVGHHGSRTSSTAAFLAAVAPRVAVISAGAGNRFGHPHPEVVERLRARTRNVLSLAEMGGVIVESDGRDLRVHSHSGLRLQL